MVAEAVREVRLGRHYLSRSLRTTLSDSDLESIIRDVYTLADETSDYDHGRIHPREHFRGTPPL